MIAYDNNNGRAGARGCDVVPGSPGPCRGHCPECAVTGRHCHGTGNSGARDEQSEQSVNNQWRVAEEVSSGQWSPLSALYRACTDVLRAVM